MADTPHDFEVLRRLLSRGANKHIVKILARRHAADIALVFWHIHPSDWLKLLRLVPNADERAQVIVEADSEFQQSLLVGLTDEEIVELLDTLAGDDAADLVEMLPEDRALKILSIWQSDAIDEIDTLRAYDPETAGGIMTPNVFALLDKTTAEEAIKVLQEKYNELENAFYLYVVNENQKLIGVCSLRQLVVSQPNLSLQEIMIPDVITVGIGTDQEQVAKLVARYNLLAIPVGESNDTLVGIVTVDDIIDVIRQEATEDMLKMAGADAAEFTEQANPIRSAKLRMPWLLASFVGGISSMLIISQFQGALEEIAALAAFIPVTLGMGGNVGTQAATIITRSIALGRVNFSKLFYVVSKEIITGSALGLFYGFALALVAMLTYSGGGSNWASWQLAATVALAVGGSMTISAAVGGAVPLIFHRLGFDPAISTGPVITTSSDIIGITVYFMIGKILLPIQFVLTAIPSLPGFPSLLPPSPADPCDN